MTRKSRERKSKKKKTRHSLAKVGHSLAEGWSSQESMPSSSLSCTRTLVRLPAFIVIYTIIIIELIWYGWTRLFIHVYELFFVRCRTYYADNSRSRQTWSHLHARGCSYSEWFSAATDLDHALGMSDGKLDRNREPDAVVLKISERLQSALYGLRSTKSNSFMKRLTQNSVKDIVADLRLACSPHLGSVGTESSYRWNHRGTNSGLHSFSELTESALLHVLRSREIFQGMNGAGKRLRLFHSLKQTYGTTALCLSGGAGNGCKFSRGTQFITPS